MGRPKKRYRVNEKSSDYRKGRPNRPFYLELPPPVYSALVQEVANHPPNSAEGYSLGSWVRTLVWNELNRRGANLGEPVFTSRGRPSKSETP